MSKGKRDWPRIVEEHQSSGDSVKEFCASRGIHPNTFYKKRKLYGRQPLVEVPVTGSIDVGPMEVRVGRYRVSVHRGFDRDCLKSVLEVIGELA